MSFPPPSFTFSYVFPSMKLLLLALNISSITLYVSMCDQNAQMTGGESHQRGGDVDGVSLWELHL